MAVRLTLNIPLVEKLLKERGWSRARLARELVLDPSTVTYYLRGRSVEPSGIAVVSFQRVFPEHRDQLFTEHREVTATTEVATNTPDAIGA